MTVADFCRLPAPPGGGMGGAYGALGLRTALLVTALACAACGGDSGTSRRAPLDAIPSFDNATVEDKAFVKGEAIANETLPEAMGGDGALTYSLSPEPPAGLTFNPASRVLSGTPTAGQPATEYTYRATDSDAANPDTATIRFNIAVNERLSLSASAASINEWEDQGRTEVRVSMGRVARSDLVVRLQSTGSAVLGGDFDFPALGEGDPALTIVEGASSATVAIRPIRDLDKEGDENITLAVTGVAGDDAASLVFDTAGLRIAIKDAGEPTADTGEVALAALLAGLAFLEARLEATIKADVIDFAFQVLNFGGRASSATSASMQVRAEDGTTLAAVAHPAQIAVPALAPGDQFRGRASLMLEGLQPGRDHTFELVVKRTPEEPSVDELGAGDEDSQIDVRASVQYHIDARGQVRVTCTGFDRSMSPGVEDPLFPEQWALVNTGQKSYARNGGVAGEDLRMAGAIRQGLDGDGVQVAVVDGGIEICHPDLAENIEPGASYNFLVGVRHGARADDPFVPTHDGGHGTSVAGLVAAVANNGVGGRGVAPRVRLRGFNLIDTWKDEIDPEGLEFDALGMSTENPRSSDVHIFNMSYGAPRGGENLGTDKVNLFKAGVEKLRPMEGDGKPLGAVYVKAAGNVFDGCLPYVESDRERALHPNFDIGCHNANQDPESNYPYVITVGAFNADGKRSSYSCAGANLWVAAPGGENGSDKPGLITTDQMGVDRGRSADEFGLTTRLLENALGDYTATFGGTSGAVPNATGAVALLLGVKPELTWRDIKYLLAGTARQLHADIPEVRVAFGGKPAVLQHAWVTNAAGYRFHNWYGFGAVDVDAALAGAAALEPDGLGEFIETAPIRQADAVAVPDHDGAGITLTQGVDLPPGTHIEAMQLRIEATHERVADLGFTLTSPAGTPSVVNPVMNRSLEHLEAEEDGNDPAELELDWKVLSNAFYGEAPEGGWTLNVIDAVPGKSGRLDAWSLVFYLGEHPTRP